MKRLPILAASGFVLVFLVPPTLGANTTLSAAGINHLVRTNTSGGSCISYLDDSYNSLTTICSDGGITITINATVGCISVVGGTGQCTASDDPPTTLNATIEITCPGGKTFTLSTGNTDSASSCHTSTTGPGGMVTGAHCGQRLSPDTEGNQSTVDCALNNNQGACVSTTGSGTCVCKNCS